MTESSFTSFVPQPVLEQIKARENKWGKEHKTAEELEVIHGNTVWCLLRSGVDAPEDPANRFKIVQDPKEIKTTPKYALKGVLGGDNLSSKSLKRAGVQTGNDADTTFYNITSQGHKPKPGIIGFNVKTLDTWGMVLEATINIKVWSRDDLEDMDLIYFKPGYTALFEWGHTLYFDPKGNICKTPRTMVSNELFFKGGKFEDLDDLIFKARQQDCNREAVFGYITNFSWSFNHDGSFDCSLKILSKGAVLESLKACSHHTNESNPEKQDGEIWWSVSDYHRLLKALNERYNKNVKGTISAVQGKLENDGTVEFLTSLPSALTVNEGNGVVSIVEALKAAKGKEWSIDESIWANMVDCPAIAVPLTRKGKKKGLKCFYVTLQTLCNIINHFQKTSTPTYFQLITRSEQVYGHYLFSYPDQMKMPSLNPLIAIKQSQITDPSFSITKDGGRPFETCVKAWTDTVCKKPDRILNIWVNLNIFASILEDKIRNEIDYPLYPALEEFLGSVQKAFGNVNSFGLHGDSAFTGFFEIVDRAQIGQNKAGNIPTLNISGLYNTVVDLKINSDVSQDLVNEMCIAAVAPKEGTVGTENTDECLVFWGENCKSRWYHEPFGEETKPSVQKLLTSKDEQQVRDAFFDRLSKFYEGFRNEKVGNNTKGEAATDSLVASVSNEVENYQLDGERYYKNQVRKDIRGKSEFQAGIIPYKTTITLLGISRLYIGNTFKIKNGILPRKYDDWGYLITGIEHSVRNNQWFTTLKTNYYPVFPGEKFKAPSETVQSSENERVEKPANLKDGVIEVTSASTSDSNTVAGDGSGREVITYKSRLSTFFSGGYTKVYRNQDSATAKEAASIAKKLARNDLVGYSNPNRNTLYNRLVVLYNGDVDKYFASEEATDTDCSAFCHTCYAAVDPIKYAASGQRLATTANMSPLTSKGSWTEISLSDITAPGQLQEGDIIWRGAGSGKTGHVVMVTAIL